MIRLRESSPILSSELARRLDQKKIGTRMLFGGNVTRQPALIQLKKDRKNAFRIVGSLKGADELMNRTIFLGVYPGLNRNMIDYQIENLHSIFNKI
jgi:CDP-6-deoxy-D-xylo-4-hexulose-3-dehydrase